MKRVFRTVMLGTDSKPGGAAASGCQMVDANRGIEMMV